MRTSVNLYGHCTLGYKTFLTLFSLYVDATDKSKIRVAINIEFNSLSDNTPFLFFANTPFKLLKYDNSKI